MNKRKNRNKRGIITVGGNLMAPGQKRPNVIVLTQPKRFGLDIADYMAAIRAAENVDFSTTCIRTSLWTHTFPA